MKTSPLPLLLALFEAAPALVASAAIPGEVLGPTFERVQNLAANPSPENMRYAYDGGTPPPFAAFAMRSPSTAPGVPAPTALAAQKPKHRPPASPKIDDATIGFAALGMATGGMIGFALVGALGPFGPLLGALLGLIVLVSLWRARGYKPYKKPKK